MDIHVEGYTGIFRNKLTAQSIIDYVFNNKVDLKNT